MHHLGTPEKIAEQEGVAQYTIWKYIRAYLGEVRREDKAAVQAEYDLQRPSTPS